MYDKITIRLYKTCITSEGVIVEIPDIRDKLTFYEDDWRDGISRFGYLENMKVRLFENRYEITGSLAKFYFGDNIRMLDIDSTREAIGRLSNELGVDLCSYGTLTGLEFGFNMWMRKEVVVYLRKMVRYKDYRRVFDEGTTLYFRQKREFSKKTFELCIYDKSLESKDNGVVLPKGLEENLLRFEMRFFRKLGIELGIEKVKGERIVPIPKLWDEKFYCSLVRKLQDCYFCIEKETNISYDDLLRKDMESSERKQPQDLFRLMLAKKGVTMGDLEETIQEAKKVGYFPKEDKSYYNKVRKNYRKYLCDETYTKDDEAIRELDTDVMNVGAWIGD